MFNLCGRTVQSRRLDCSVFAVRLFNSKRSGCSTWAEYSILRRFAGGYHTSTYLRCQILFLLNQLLFVCLIKTLEESIYFGISLFLACMSVLIIWLIAPIDHENRRFNENEYCYFKTMSRMYSLVIIISFIIMSVFPKTRLLLLSHLLGVFLASCSVLVAFVQKKLKK